ncbi:MAG TPA: GAF domain-containing protein, partial [Myxococcaceae bacterium]|nr:GAF domain-containing protein [Myxococcaceae bacterium]
MIPLRSIASCFEGIIPAMMSTCSLEGEPNITEISQVHLVDEKHVALSHQFFNKTQRNVRENPHATIQVFAPVTYDLYQLHLRFDHPETEGPLFEEMSARLQVIASHTGMLGVFKLRCADVYEVLSVEQLTNFFLPADPRLDPPQATTGVLDAMARELRSLRAISDRVNQASCLEVLLESALQALDEQLGFHHSMVLLPDDRGHLVTTASHGYGSAGVGAEVPLGEGLIGMVAARQRPMRVAGVGAELRYWRTIRAELQHTGSALPAPEIPLPGLPDAQAQLGLPLLVGDRLIGVLALESPEAMAFDAWTETFLNILANQIALGIDRAS